MRSRTACAAFRRDGCRDQMAGPINPAYGITNLAAATAVGASGADYRAWAEVAGIRF